MKPSALFTMILIALLYLLSAQRASAQDTYAYTTLTYDGATNTVRGYSVTYPDYNVQGYYSSKAAIGLSSWNPDGSDLVYHGGETIEGPYYGTAEANVSAPYTPGRIYSSGSDHYHKTIYEEWFYPPNEWMEPELRSVDYYNFHSYEGPGGGGITYEISYVFHGPGPRYLLDRGTQDIYLGGTLLNLAPTVSKIQYVSDSVAHDISGTLYVLAGTSVTFKAVPSTGSTWPNGRPTWSGTSGASGTGGTISVTFNQVSSSTSDYKTVIATSQNSVTVNVIVYNLTGVLTPATNFPNRSYVRFGIEEEVGLNFTSSPSGITASQAGGLRWKLTTGNTTGTLVTSADNGTGTYTAPDAAASATLRLEVQGGPSKGQGVNTNISIVEPSDGVIYRTSGIRHTQYKWGVGFFGQIVVTPTDVSFFNIAFREGGAPMISSGWLSDINIYHEPSARWIAINSRNEVNTADQIDSGDKSGPVLGGTPFAAGYWYWDIPWYFGTRTNGRVVHFVTKQEIATSDAAGTAVISKAGASESKAANDPTTTY